MKTTGSSEVPQAEFFSWKKHPFFTNGLRPDDYVLTNRERDFLPLAETFLNLGKSFAVIAPPGTGKTTFARIMIRNLDPKEYRVVFIPSSRYQGTGLLRLIAETLQFDPGKRGIPVLAKIQRHLLDTGKESHRPFPVLVIDDAQSLEPASFTDLCSLMSHPEKDGSIASLILLGDQSLGRMLELSTMLAVRSRLAFLFRLEPLSEKDGKDLIKSRLKAAQAPEGLFDPDALELLTAQARGNRRDLLNRATVLCTEAYHRKERIITGNLVVTSLLLSDQEK